MHTGHSGYRDPASSVHLWWHEVGSTEKLGPSIKDMEPQECGLGKAESGCCQEARKYLVLMTSIVVEGSPNKSTPDQLGMAMFYL